MDVLALIFGFVLIVAAFGLAAGIIIHRRQIAHDERKLELEREIEQAKADQARFANGDYRKMEERVRVLERIATENRSNLAAQIEQLRDLDMIEDRSLDKEETA
ncbi:MAG: hypothetical protein H6920_09675 [Sphingomonadaceae bacterium]|jgi:hypothetical protein|nr:hypothetical protein [Sphingomonadaceae bacterium]MCP5383249.1 hypothetical protein [Altererythrobacter sp.]MCP5391875.1 hypothetical protein [Sphingomonadaceae bacterium]MCP5393426.1 hypothetical protein [Sphingomonadaceae bacterium]